MLSATALLRYATRVTWGDTLPVFRAGLGAAGCHALIPAATMPLLPGIKLFWAEKPVLLPSKCLEHLPLLQVCPRRGYNSQELAVPYQNSCSPLYLIDAGAVALCPDATGFPLCLQECRQ